MMCSFKLELPYTQKKTRGETKLQRENSWRLKKQIKRNETQRAASIKMNTFPFVTVDAFSGSNLQEKQCLLRM